MAYQFVVTVKEVSGCTSQRQITTHLSSYQVITVQLEWCVVVVYNHSFPQSYHWSRLGPVIWFSLLVSVATNPFLGFLGHDEPVVIHSSLVCTGIYRPLLVVLYAGCLREKAHYQKSQNTPGDNQEHINVYLALAE